MKGSQPIQFVLLLFICCAIVSCAKDSFAVRKNFQPRIKIERSPESVSTIQPADLSSPATSHPIKTHTPVVREERVDAMVESKPTIAEKMVRKSFSKKQEAPDHRKKTLHKSNDPNLDGSQTAGLIIGIIAMCFAIASYLMIIVMAGGSLYTGFIIGLVLAAAAIAMGFIGKQLGFRGISLVAGILGIIAVFVLMVFLVLIIVGII